LRVFARFQEGFIVGQRGPEKKPSNIRILEGNPGKRPIKNEVKPAPVSSGKPKFLKGEAADEWSRVSVKLERLGLLTEIDSTALAAYCQAYARWVQLEADADRAIAEHDGQTTYDLRNGATTVHPQIAAAANMMKVMASLLSKFGMSPSDRAGLVVDKQEDEAEGMASLLSK
jgi:P27 family predicted phage terminase small subunit